MNQAVDGDYQFKIKVVDKYNLSQTFTGNIHVRLTKIVISYPSMVQFSSYSGSEVYYKLSQSAKVTIEIFNDLNVKVKTIKQNVSVNEGIQYFKWDGKDSYGYYEYGNMYYYVITAQNGYGQNISVKGEMNSSGNPSWLVDQDFDFHEDPNHY